jgi:hypothetical protein
VRGASLRKRHPVVLLRLTEVGGARGDGYRESDGRGWPLMLVSVVCRKETPMLSLGRRCWPRGRQTRFFTVLALECSADDTCAAVVTSTGQILSNVVIKQNHMCVCAVSLYDVRSHTAIDMKASEAYILTAPFKPINETWWAHSTVHPTSLTRETAWCGPESTQRCQHRRGAGRRYRLYAWAR